MTFLQVTHREIESRFLWAVFDQTHMKTPTIEIIETSVALGRFGSAALKCLEDVVDRLHSAEKVGGKAWLTQPEAQKYLGLSKPTLARYRAAGKLPYSKVGSSCFYRLVDLEALLESGLTPISRKATRGMGREVS